MNQFEMEVTLALVAMSSRIGRRNKLLRALDRKNKLNI
jgi:hypothetical protein